MAGDYDGWEPIGEPLGEGGQGIVYKARSPERVKQLRQSTKELQDQFRRLDNHFRQVDDDLPLLEDLAKHILHVGGPDSLVHLGALKQFEIPSGNPEEAAKAVGRLQSEVQALQTLDHPAILKLLHANVQQHFIVTEYHPHGTLDQHLDRYKGKALEALEAFRTLVRGVSVIHQKGAIHRDIKPQNIFVADDGRFLLGDFGIVFFKDAQGTRLTETYERVGSHYWMAPWAYEAVQLALEKIDPTLDIYPLGKVLWAMISGRNGFPFWEYDKPENNLAKQFPSDPAMPLVNRCILSKCVVREQAECLASATDLLSWVNAVIDELHHMGEKPYEDDRPWPCRMCGKGHYAKATYPASMSITGAQAVVSELRLALYVCDHCKHAEFFRE